MGIVRAGFLLAGFFVIHISNLLGQYSVSGDVMDNASSLADVNVVLSEMGKRETISVSGAGKFYKTLEWDKTYYFKFSKEGYVSKVIQFVTTVPTHVRKEQVEPYHLQVRLFKMFDGVDTVFFNKPVAIIKYDESINDFAADRDYSLNVKYKIDQMRAGNYKPETIIKPMSNKKEPEKKIQKPKTKHQEKERASKEKTPEVGDTDVEIGIPPLKEAYKVGVTKEYFNLDHRYVTRSIIHDGTNMRVLVMVKHEWGGEFYFLDKLKLGYVCISKELYDNLKEF